MGVHLSVPELHVESGNEENEEIRASLQSMQGYRTEMEDDHVIELNMSKLPGWSFFGVFDGHAGDGCSKFIAKSLVKKLVNDEAFIKAAKQAELNEPRNSYYNMLHPLSIEETRDESLHNSHPTDSPQLNGDSTYSTHSQDLFDCITNAYKSLDHVFHEEFAQDKSGTTATCVLISPKSYYFINLGDSRTILCGDNQKGNLIFATEDHKPSDQKEKARIQLAGGDVAQGRINSLLAVSRAFGDFDYKDVNLQPEDRMVSVIPEITVVPRDISHSGIICACDGVWDIYTSEQVALFQKFFWRASDDLADTTKRLLFSSLEKGSKDNISLIAIQFKKRSSDLYDPECDEAKYLQNFKKHVYEQSDIFINSLKAPKYDNTNVQKFKVREAIKINNNFMRKYNGNLSVNYMDVTSSSPFIRGNKEENDDNDQSGTAKIVPIKTYLDFQKSEDLYQKHSKTEFNIIPHLGPDIYYEDVQLKAEKFIEQANSADFQT